MLSLHILTTYSARLGCYSYLEGTGSRRWNSVHYCTFTDVSEGRRVSVYGRSLEASLFVGLASSIESSVMIKLLGVMSRSNLDVIM